MSKARDNNSIRQKCEDAGISISTYFWRVRHGWENPYLRANITRISEEKLKLLESNGISRQLFSARKSHGWTELEASNVPPSSPIYKMNGKSVRSQIPLSRYDRFRRLVVEFGLPIEDAVKYALKGGRIDR